MAEKGVEEQVLAMERLHRKGIKVLESRPCKGTRGLSGCETDSEYILRGR